jgi:hypothetical protein
MSRIVREVEKLEEPPRVVRLFGAADYRAFTVRRPSDSSPEVVLNTTGLPRCGDPHPDVAGLVVRHVIPRVIGEHRWGVMILYGPEVCRVSHQADQSRALGEQS